MPVGGSANTQRFFDIVRQVTNGDVCHHKNPIMLSLIA
jgi:hypothetical protein